MGIFWWDFVCGGAVWLPPPVAKMLRLPRSLRQQSCKCPSSWSLLCCGPYCPRSKGKKDRKWHRRGKVNFQLDNLTSGLWQLIPGPPFRSRAQVSQFEERRSRVSHSLEAIHCGHHWGVSEEDRWSIPLVWWDALHPPSIFLSWSTGGIIRSSARRIYGSKSTRNFPSRPLQRRSRKGSLPMTLLTQTQMERNKRCRNQRRRKRSKESARQAQSSGDWIPWSL